MFAPVVNRFDVYDLVTSGDTLSYMAAVKAHPAWRKWEEAARAEPWIVPHAEVCTGIIGFSKNLFRDWSRPFIACISAQNFRNRDMSFRPPVWPEMCCP
jgi:hypothetical protein